MAYTYIKKAHEGLVAGAQFHHVKLDPIPEHLVLLPEGQTPSEFYWKDGQLCRYTDAELERFRNPPAHAGFEWSVATMSWLDARDFDQAKRDKLLEINQAFELSAAQLTAGYPSSEKLTWGIQQSEALAWLADPTSPTPYLDGLAAARGIDPLDMRQRTATKVAAFMEASKRLVGMRQALEAAIEAATDRAQLEQICWPQAI